MAILTKLERTQIFRPWIQEVMTALDQSKKLNRTDLEAAVQYTEDKLQAAKTNYVAGLPEPFKSNTNGNAKRLLFAYTVMKDAGLL